MGRPSRDDLEAFGPPHPGQSVVVRRPGRVLVVDYGECVRRDATSAVVRSGRDRQVRRYGLTNYLISALPSR